MQKLINNIKINIKYLYSRIKLVGKKFDINIMSIEDTLKIMSNKVSIIRFGDGEFSLMGNKNVCPFQKETLNLKESLITTINTLDNDNVLICLPETMKNLNPFAKKTQKLWTINFYENYDAYSNNYSNKYVYGNAFVSRPYMIYKDKSYCAKYFEMFKSLFKNQDIVIIEGRYSRLGVGNDLFSRAKSIKRIICPPQNAWDKYDLILNESLKVNKDALIITSIGPTSKPLAMELIKKGYWVLDLGHIDSEYEWFLAKDTVKREIKNKHTAEIEDSNLEECTDLDYLDSIIAEI